jgi:hypothetical protein
MRFHDSDDHQRQRETRVLHTGPSLSRHEGHNIFREMVRGEARNGPLTATRRKRLIQYAAALRLSPMQASRIVTEVCRECAQPTELAPPVIYRLVETAATPHRWPVWLKITLTLMAAFAADQLVRTLM